VQKVFNSCYFLDQRCYESYGLTEDILMEHIATGLAKLQLDRTSRVGGIKDLEDTEVIVDAFLGAGLNKPLDSSTQQIIQ
jgi:NAD(P)H-hydrate repair Nnr-like enzyme with NAD(P)H-hydrate epimerase domain